MTKLRLLLTACCAVVGWAAAAGPAAASGHPCNGPFCNQAGYPRYHSLFGHLFSHQPLPVYQAAPWYLYWPYDAHFLTPAPVSGAFYGPPIPGNFPINPYFPAPAYGGYGPMPGGPPPVSPVPPVPPVPPPPPPLPKEPGGRDALPKDPTPKGELPKEAPKNGPVPPAAPAAPLPPLAPSFGVRP